MPHVSFRNIKEGENKSFLPPIGKYPCIMRVEAYKRDAQGALMTGGDNQPAQLTTGVGDPMWNLENVILDGDYFDKSLLDNLSFGEKAAARAAAIFVHAGMMPSVKDCEANPALWPQRERDFEPDELDGTCWWVTISHEAGNKESQRPFKNNGCTCATCVAANGRNVFVNAKPDFHGYQLMSPTEAKKYKEAYAARKASRVDHPVGAPGNEAENSRVPF